MNMRCFIQVLLALASLVFGGPALAQVYGGAGYGITEPSVTGDDAVFPELEGDTGFRVYLGNSISEYYSVEVSYVDLGTYDVGTLGGLPDPTEFVDTLSIDGVNLGFIGKWPIRRRVSLYSKIGIFAWRGERYIEDEVDINGTITQRQILSTSEDVDVSAGVGANYRFHQRFGVVLDASMYKTVETFNMMGELGVYFSF